MEILGRTDERIEATLAAAKERIGTRSKWPGMSYEQGVVAGIEWLQRRDNENPMELFGKMAALLIEHPADRAERRAESH